MARLEEQIRETSLRDVYYVLFRHKGKALCFFLFVALATVVATFLRPNIYRSEAKLMLRLGRESISLDATVTTSERLNVSLPDVNYISPSTTTTLPQPD